MLGVIEGTFERKQYTNTKYKQYLQYNTYLIGNVLK